MRNVFTTFTAAAVRLCSTPVSYFLVRLHIIPLGGLPPYDGHDIQALMRVHGDM